MLHMGGNQKLKLGCKVNVDTDWLSPRSQRPETEAAFQRPRKRLSSEVGLQTNDQVSASRFELPIVACFCSLPPTRVAVVRCCSWIRRKGEVREKFSWSSVEVLLALARVVFIYKHNQLTKMQSGAKTLLAIHTQALLPKGSQTHLAGQPGPVTTPPRFNEPWPIWTRLKTAYGPARAVAPSGTVLA